MLKFYDIAEDYVKYLQTIDRQIPNIHYNTNNKFVCGILFEIKGVKYYATISHTVKKFRQVRIINYLHVLQFQNTRRGILEIQIKIKNGIGYNFCRR